MPILFLFAEGLVFFVIAHQFGFWWTLLGYWLPSLFAILILSRISKPDWSSLQTKVAQNVDFGPQVLGLASRAVGALLLLLPFLSTRFFGVLLLLPGLGRILFFALQFYLLKRFAKAKIIFNGADIMREWARSPNSSSVRRGTWSAYESSNQGDPSTIDAEFTKITEEQIASTKRPSQTD